MKEKVIYFVTKNNGKFAEVKRFIEDKLPFLKIKQIAVDLFERQTFNQRKIATEKASSAWELIKKPLLIDDTGVYFKQYNNFPGPFTKFVFQGIGKEGIARLVKGNSAAYLLVMLVYVNRDGDIKIFEGRTEGDIIVDKNKQLPEHLPFSGIFYPNGFGGICLMDKGIDPVLFHPRFKALAKFVKWYRELSDSNLEIS